MSVQDIVGHFREQAELAERFGSPFTGRLAARLLSDFEAGGPVADLIRDWPTNPRADALALRLTGALHAAALTKRDPELAALYPEARADWDMNDVWPVARAFLAREPAWAADFIQSPPQTNEIRRTIALLPAFLEFGRSFEGPIDTFEIGASAGLNLHWDSFRYETPTWSWGPQSPVTVTTDWQGPPPHHEARLRVRHRAGCDLNPLNVSDEAQRLRLRAYVWADQLDRLARFEGAVSLALANKVQVDRTDAIAWLEAKLAQRAGDAATLIYHSIFLQYPSREERAKLAALIRRAGEAASAQAPLAYVRLELEELIGGTKGSYRYRADMITWPGGVRRTICHTDAHSRVVWVD